jgi:hypothetical protein
MAPVLIEQLAAATARRRGLSVAGDDGDRSETATALTNEVADQRTLRAQRQAVTRVLHVGAHDESAVRGDGAGADRDVRIRDV